MGLEVDEAVPQHWRDCAVTRRELAQVPRRYLFPEPVQEADVVVILGGWDGTHDAASWARLANKPIVPVAAFGLAAAEIFEDEVASFDRRPTGRISLEEFQILGDLSEPSMNVYYEVGYAQALGKDVVATAREGTKLPFDLFDIPTLFWDSQDTLETKLKFEVARLAAKFGREIGAATS